MEFNYEEAFSRNIGWISKEEQKVLQSKTIAIPGMGGVGGSHAVALARLGVSNFKIADMDDFDVANFNRQAGAFMSTIGKSKVDVMKNFILDINPKAKVEVYEKGINEDNLEEFFKGVDLFIDGLDIYAIKARMSAFHYAHSAGIPILTAGPLGMGTSLLAFNPKGLDPIKYFNFELKNTDPNMNLLKFIMGLAPNSIFLQGRYLVDQKAVSFKERRTPSTPMGCYLATGVIVTAALKVLLGRGPIIWAPRGIHFDSYLNKTSKFWRPWGNNNPLQKLLLSIASKRYS